MQDIYKDKSILVRGRGWLRVRFYWVEMEDGIDPGHWETYEKGIDKKDYIVESPDWESAFYDRPEQRGQTEAELLKYGESFITATPFYCHKDLGLGAQMSTLINGKWIRDKKSKA